MITPIAAIIKNSSSSNAIEAAIVIPPAFQHSRELWDRRGRKRSWPKDQWQSVKACIEPFLYATIDPEQSHYDNGLLNTRGTIHARSVELTSLSFENGPIPIVSAIAHFELLFDRPIGDTEQLYDWMERTEWLDCCVNFGWRFQNDNEFDAAETHDGIQFDLSTP